MELNALNQIFPMSYPHYLPFIRPGGDFQFVGKGFLFNQKRVIPRSLKWVGHTIISPFSVVVNQRGLSMKESLCPHDVSTKSITDRLMAKADPEDWNPSRKFLDQIHRNSRFLRGAWPG